MRSLGSRMCAAFILIAGFATVVASPPAVSATPAASLMALPAPGSGAGIVFVDALKQAAPWSSSEQLAVDANGNVTALRPGQVADATVYANENYPAGDYTLLYDGRATFAFSGATIVAQTPGRALVRVAPNAGAGLHLRLLATDPRDYARNVRLILPGFEGSYRTAPFHPAFVRAVAQLDVIRFSQWNEADSFAVSAVWPNRPGVDRFTQTMPGGVAPEYEIALANATGKTPWFALPVGATNLYVSRFADLVHRTLDPRLTARFQYGGAVWQAGTPGNGWAIAAGRNALGSGGDQAAAVDWYAARSAQVFDLVRRAFGPDAARATRVVTGPAADSASATALDRALIAKLAGHVDAFAFAPNGDAGATVASRELARAHGLEPLLANDGGASSTAATWTARPGSAVPAYHAALLLESHHRRNRAPVVPAFVRPSAPLPEGPELTAMVGQTLPHPDFAAEGNEDWIRSAADAADRPLRMAHAIRVAANALALDAPAGPVERVLRVYVSENRARPVLRAALSDGSAAPATVAHESRFGRSEAVYTLEYRAKTESTLHVTLGPDGPGQVALRAATLHSAAVPSATPSPSDMTMYHNDLARSGWDPNEYALNESTVSGRHFGLLGTLNVQGDVLAQPLYVANYNLGSKGVHNLLIVATEHDEIYEFDADDGTLLNSRIYGTSQSSSDVGCADISPEYGITSTPVIDRPNGVLYFVVSDETPAKRFETLLFAVDLATLAPKKSPVAITAKAKMSNGSTIALNPAQQQVRPGLVLANGALYMAVGSHCDFDAGGITGWMLRYDPTTLQQTAAITMGEDTNSSLLNSIWMTGFAPAVDASGNLLAVTGNGEFDAAYGGTNYGESAVKIAPDLSSVLTSFTPAEYHTLDSEDGDFGSGGIMLLPQQTGNYPNLAVAMGKSSTMYLLSTDALGGIGHPVASYSVPGGGVWGGPAYYNGPNGLFVYYQSDQSGLSDYLLKVDSSGNPHLYLSSRGSSQGGYGGSLPIVSSWGQMPESGVVWLVQRNSTVRLEAYAARGATRLLFAANAGVWNNPNNNAFVTPMVANGKVYVPASGTITVFGLQ